MSDQFIPSSDYDFKFLAAKFVRVISSNPSAYFVMEDDVALLAAASERFSVAQMAAMNRHHRSPAVTAEKRASRTELEKMIRRLVKLIRANDKISFHDKLALGLQDPIAKGKKKEFPTRAPRLTFVRAHHESGGASPMHELKFCEITEDSVIRKSRPSGATRLELFVDLIPPDAPIPNNPGATPSGRPWYLRSYTKSPIVLEPPMARVPMRVVYWARWADSAGNVGPFSSTVVGWIEGGNVSRPAQYMGSIGKKETPMISVDAPKQLTDESTYSVAVIEAHYLSVNTSAMREEHPKLEVTVIKEAKQIEGPVEEAA